MKDIFYGVVLFVFVGYVYMMDDVDDVECYEHKLKNYNNSVVVDKEIDFIGNKIMTLYDTARIHIKCDGIIFNQYAIGDTILAKDSR